LSQIAGVKTNFAFEAVEWEWENRSTNFLGYFCHR